MSDPFSRKSVIPANGRDARRWVRLHWQDFMRGADVPDLGSVPDEAADLIADVFCDESRKLAERLNPRARP